MLRRLIDWCVPEWALWDIGFVPYAVLPTAEFIQEQNGKGAVLTRIESPLVWRRCLRSLNGIRVQPYIPGHTIHYTP